MEALADQVEALRATMAVYENQQAQVQATLKEAVQAEVLNQQDQLRNLWLECKKTIDQLDNRMRIVESKTEQSTSEKKDHRSLVNPKFNNVSTLQDFEGWSAWKSDVEDYCEKTFKGMKKSMEYAKNEKGQPDMQLQEHAEK